MCEDDDDDDGKCGCWIAAVLSWTNNTRRGSLKIAAACSTALHLNATYNSDINGLITHSTDIAPLWAQELWCSLISVPYKLFVCLLNFLEYSSIRWPFTFGQSTFICIPFETYCFAYLPLIQRNSPVQAPGLWYAQIHLLIPALYKAFTYLLSYLFTSLRTGPFRIEAGVIRGNQTWL